jgi:hypothetical protein
MFYSESQQFNSKEQIDLHAEADRSKYLPKYQMVSGSFLLCLQKVNVFIWQLLAYHRKRKAENYKRTY